MYLTIYYIASVLLTIIVLLLLYRRILYDHNPFESMMNKYYENERNSKINNYIRYIYKKPADFHMMIFSESLTLMGVLLIIFLIVTNSLFFTAIISDSMRPSFEKNDLVLIQNIQRTYDEGDIIMFKTPDTSKPILHRIVLKSDRDNIRTAGDAIGQMDWWDLKEEDIIGKAILIHGKPLVIEDIGKFFILDEKSEEYGVFKQEYGNYFLFFEIVKLYGYFIAAASLILYIIFTVRTKPWQD